MAKNVIISIMTGIMTLPLIGCQSRDDRLAHLAAESAAQQARQSEQVAQASANLTAGAQQLVESAGRSHESFVTLQQELQAQQAEISRQRELLEQERQAIARERSTSPVIANAVLQIGVLLICLLPLILSWYVLRGPTVNAGDLAITEVLIEDLTANEPRLLPQRPPARDSDPAGHLPPAS